MARPRPRRTRSSTTRASSSCRTSSRTRAASPSPTSSGCRRCRHSRGPRARSTAASRRSWCAPSTMCTRSRRTEDQYAHRRARPRGQARRGCDTDTGHLPITYPGGEAPLSLALPRWRKGAEGGYERCLACQGVTQRRFVCPAGERDHAVARAEACLAARHDHVALPHDRRDNRVRREAHGADFLADHGRILLDVDLDNREIGVPQAC